MLQNSAHNDSTVLSSPRSAEASFITLKVYSNTVLPEGTVNYKLYAIFISTDARFSCFSNIRQAGPEVCGRSPVEIVGSNPTGGMDVCLLWVLCVVSERSLRGADHLSRGVLPTEVHRV
jgi:hypothetical protein